MSVVSFDVGIRNLAYCHIEGTRIKSWGVLDLGVKMNASTECMTKALVTTLDTNNAAFVGANKIIIEKQPSRNPKMRYIEGMLCAYFYIKGVQQGDVTTVQSYSAKHKLGKQTHRGVANYSERKKLGVKRCRAFLEKTRDTNDSMIGLFDTSKKKDDLSDSLLQALSYTQHPLFEGLSDDTAASANTDVFADVRARKPTEKQHKSKKYSRANIKYLLTQDPAMCDDVHVRKACLRHFGTATLNVGH